MKSTGMICQMEMWTHHGFPQSNAGSTPAISRQRLQTLDSPYILVLNATSHSHQEKITLTVSHTPIDIGHIGLQRQQGTEEWNFFDNSVGTSIQYTSFIYLLD
jgi:hypothetical protein